MFFDYLLLNSDGLTDFTLNQAIQEELMTDHTLEQHGQNLINLALANDSNDNVSVIYITLTLSLESLAKAKLIKFCPCCSKV